MLDHNQIVDAVIRDYVGVLNRLPDPAGLNFWAGKVEEGSISLDGVTNAFTDQLGSNPFYKFNPETTSSTVVDFSLASTMYYYVLGRPEDKAGIDFWAHSGVTAGELFKILIATPEFIKGTENAVAQWAQLGYTYPHTQEPGGILPAGLLGPYDFLT